MAQTAAAEPQDKAAKKPPTMVARRKKFLKALSRSANVSRSAKLAGVSTSTLYKWRAKTPAFATEWDAAIGEALDELEQLVIERAKHGVEKPVYYGGKLVGTVRSYSDALAMFMLKAKRPEVYAQLNAEPLPVGNDNAARAEVLRRLDKLDASTASDGDA